MSTPSFSTLPLSAAMVENLTTLGFTQMTPVQAQSLPPMLQGHDVLAQAKTGSGKTVAFGIGALHNLDVNTQVVQSLVLCPTRELADQVAGELRRLARFTENIKVLTLCGGRPSKPQRASLEHGAHIVVGTPGRILQHLQSGSLTLEALNTLVIDEAHRMLDMGFIDQIEHVIAYAPDKRQTLLFSATYPDEILTLSRNIQRNAVQIETIAVEPPNPITQYFYQVAPWHKIDALINLLAYHAPENAIVFTTMKVDAQELAAALQARAISALALHGDLEQYERTDVLIQFVNHSCSIMVATDVAARGLDIEELGMVVNYDMPQDQATYIHRIGRTGRAGHTGLAVTFYTDRETRDVETYRTEPRIFAELDSIPDNPRFTLEAPNGTLVIEAGRKEKLRPGDILGALTGDAGIPGDAVGKIDIYDRQSYVAITRELVDNARARLDRGRIKGRSYPVWLLA